MLYLMLAILSEVTGTVFVKLSEGYSRLLPSVLVFVLWAEPEFAEPRAKKHRSRACLRRLVRPRHSDCSDGEHLVVQRAGNRTEDGIARADSDRGGWFERGRGALETQLPL